MPLFGLGSFWYSHYFRHEITDSRGLKVNDLTACRGLCGHNYDFLSEI